jgi:hypothetical protein
MGCRSWREEEIRGSVHHVLGSSDGSFEYGGIQSRERSAVSFCTDGREKRGRAGAEGTLPSLPCPSRLVCTKAEHLRHFIQILTSLPTFPEKYTRKKHFPIEKYVELFEDTQLGSSSPLSPEGTSAASSTDYKTPRHTRRTPHVPLSISATVDTILYQLLHRLLALQPELSLSHLDSLSVLPLTTKDITSLPHSTDLIPFPHPNPSSHIFPAAPVANSLEWDGQISRNVESARRKAPESLRDVQGDSEALFCPMMGCGLYDCSAHGESVATLFRARLGSSLSQW